MESRENPIFGRKVFFVNPPLGFDVSVMKKLRDDEYEVYTITDYKFVKSILRSEPNSLCFINIDGLLSLNEWYNFIKSFKIDESLSSIFIGVMSGYASTGERGKFLINLQLPGGFINLSQPGENLVTQLAGILEINGAKGRRQYIRLKCNDMEDIHGYMAVGNSLFAFNIDNISSVGFACTYNPKEMEYFAKNSVHKEITLTIGKKSISCPSVVFDTRLQNDLGFSVMLFTKEAPKSNRVVIKNYIFSKLDEDFKDLAKLAMPDYTDYTQEVKIVDELPDYEVPPEPAPPKVGDANVPKPEGSDAQAASDEDVEDISEFDELDDVEEI